MLGYQRHSVQMRSPAHTAFCKRNEPWLVCLGSLAFGLLFSYPLLRHFTGIGRAWDWDYFLQLEWVSLWSVRHFHQLPLWNPYTCGGMPLFANPRSRILSPFFILHLLFGAPVGIHLEIPLHLAASFLGGYLLARIEGLATAGSIACASVFPASSWFFGHIAAGHLETLAWLWLPWIAVLVLLAIRNRALSWAALGGFITALMLGEGAAYQASHALLLAAVLCLASAAVRRSAWPLLVLAAVAVFFTGFAAIKLLPAYALLKTNSRFTDIATGYYSLRSLGTIFFSRDQYFDRASIGRLAYYEYAAYIGPFAAALAVLGFATSWKRLTLWTVAALLFFTLALGEAGFPYVWQLLHMLPPFSSERITPRFFVPFILTLGVAAGYGADFLERRFNHPGFAFAIVVVTAFIVDAWWVSVSNLNVLVAFDDFPTIATGDFRQFASGRPATNMYALAKRNRGDPTCYEAIEIDGDVVGENEHGYRGEQYLVGPGSVRLLRWTPNALWYAVDAPGNTTLVVNQNYWPWWGLAGVDGEVRPLNRLLSVRLPGGRHRFKLYYMDSDFIVGAIVSLITVIAGLLLARRDRRLERGVLRPGRQLRPVAARGSAAAE